MVRVRVKVRARAGIKVGVRVQGKLRPNSSKLPNYDNTVDM